MNTILPNFVYALILTISRLGMLPFIFCKFSNELWPLIDVGFSLPIITVRIKMDKFTTAGDWDCVAAVERLPALHYSLDFNFMSFGIMGFIWEL